tara:strand:+ start:448 stop:585 length:138 start_codon:yes stop_codon:yes gene_type:complete
MATDELNLECQPAFVENKEFGKIEQCGILIPRDLGRRDAKPMGKV